MYILVLYQCEEEGGRFERN